MSNTSWNTKPSKPAVVLDTGRRVLFLHGDGNHYFGVIRCFDFTLCRYEVILNLQGEDYMHLCSHTNIVATI